MNILAIYYTQSGQLEEIVKNFVAPIEDATVDLIRFRPKKDYPFPWNDRDFYNEMPDSVQEVPVDLEEINYKHTKYDLIIIGYQPWFLSPSIPATSLLKDERFKAILKDTPVVTIIGARNMWLNAQESVKKLIKDAGGLLVGNVPLVDRTTNLISAMTIVHWMKTGKKTRMFGFFPLPGVSDEDIKGVSTIGQLLNASLKENNLKTFQKRIVEAGAVNINPNILFIEERAKRIFVIWANLIRKKEKQNGNKTFWTQFFRYYLLTALFVVSPILLLFYNVFFRPFMGASLKRKKEYFYSTELINK